LRVSIGWGRITAEYLSQATRLAAFRSGQTNSAVVGHNNIETQDRSVPPRIVFCSTVLRRWNHNSNPQWSQAYLLCSRRRRLTVTSVASMAVCIELELRELGWLVRAVSVLELAVDGVEW